MEWNDEGFIIIFSSFPEAFKCVLLLSMTSLVPIVERSFRHRCTFNFKASCSLCVCLCVCRLLCVCVLFPFQKMPVQVLQYRDITGIGQNPVSPVPEHRLDVIC